MENTTIQQDYTRYEEGYQLCLPLEIGIWIPADDPVRLLNAVVERMDFRKTKSKEGYPIETTIYECKHCDGCPCKEKCIRPGGKSPVLE